MLINPGDVVDVRQSRSGYTGSGIIIDLAYGSNWLVKVKLNNKETIILVRFQDLGIRNEIKREESKKWDGNTKKSRGRKQAT